MKIEYEGSFLDNIKRIIAKEEYYGSKIRAIYLKPEEWEEVMKALDTPLSYRNRFTTNVIEFNGVKLFKDF